jgi:putative flippase GtrA
MAKIKELFLKYRSFIMYAVFGVLTTLVNMGAYALCYNVIGISNVPSTIIAWFLAVCFAFVTNKLWVFDSPSFSADVLKHEIPTFFGARIATGLLDVGIMYLAVDVLHWNATLWKLLSNILVIIINYVASKLVIFRHHEKRETGDS